MCAFDPHKQFGYQVGFDLIKESEQYLEITTDGDRHTFPFSCPAEVGVAHFATDLISRMATEIKNLREQLVVSAGREAAMCELMDREGIHVPSERIHAVLEEAKQSASDHKACGMYAALEMLGLGDIEEE